MEKQGDLLLKVNQLFGCNVNGFRITYYLYQKPWNILSKKFNNSIT
jgi:hypothetical protein